MRAHPKLFSDDILASYHICDFAYSEEAQAVSFQSFAKWVHQGHAGPLSYLKDHRFEKRKDLRYFYKDFQSSIIFLFDYSHQREKWQHFYRSPLSNGLKIASYALGFKGYDYHLTIRDHLLHLGKILQQKIKGLEFIYSLDVHPVLEKDLAYRAGLGWFGKNSLLLHKKYGSFFMIGSLLLNQKLDLPQRTKEVDHCGQCTRCIDTCPTQAIDHTTRTIIANKCISTFTIELFKSNTPPPPDMEKAHGEIFGCDICQDVCPWNQRPFKEELFPWAFSPKAFMVKEFFLLRNPIKVLELLGSITKRGFRKLFKGTPYARTGRDGLIKNILFWS